MKEPTPLRRPAEANPRVPVQDRSQRTLELLLLSAEEVLRVRTFDEASLQEIVPGAGVTTGAFYARFAAKDDLLRYLEDAVTDSVRQATAAQFQKLQETGSDARVLLRGMLADLIESYSAHRGVLRALMERSRVDEALRGRRLEFNRKTIEAAQRALALALAPGGPELEARIRVGILFMLGTLREVFLHREFWPAELTPPAAGLIDELVEAFFAYVESSSIAAPSS